MPQLGDKKWIILAIVILIVAAIALYMISSSTPVTSSTCTVTENNQSEPYLINTYSVGGGHGANYAYYRDLKCTNGTIILEYEREV